MTSTLTDITFPDESSTTVGVYSSLLLLILMIALKAFNLWERRRKDSPAKRQAEDIEAIKKWVDKTHARVKADHKMMQTIMNHFNLKVEAASS